MSPMISISQRLVLLIFSSTFLLALLFFHCALSPYQTRFQKERTLIEKEFIIVMEWDYERQDDIDLYVQDPSKTIVHFRN